MNLLEKRLKQKYPNEDFKVIKYTCMKDKALVQCNNCNTIYNMTAEHYVRNTKVCFCYDCCKELIGKNKYQQKINEKFPNEEIEIIEFNGEKGRLKVKCKKCKNIFTYNKGENILLAHKKKVCTHCHPNKEEAMNNSIKKFEEWLDNKNIYFKDFVIPERINSEQLIESTCVICGRKNYKTIYNYKNGVKCKCILNNEILSPEQVQKRIGTNYQLISEYKGLDTPCLIRHKDCGFIFKTKIKTGVCCPKCKGSKGEKEIQSYLKSKEIEFIKEYTANIKGHNLRFDFYLPSFGIYIEFQGEHPVEYFGGQEQFLKQQKYDEYKKDYAKDKLLCIKYDENIEEKINSFLIKLNEQVT